MEAGVTLPRCPDPAGGTFGGDSGTGKREDHLVRTVPTMLEGPSEGLRGPASAHPDTRSLS